MFNLSTTLACSMHTYMLSYVQRQSDFTQVLCVLLLLLHLLHTDSRSHWTHSCTKNSCIEQNFTFRHFNSSFGNFELNACEFTYMQNNHRSLAPRTTLPWWFIPFSFSFSFQLRITYIWCLHNTYCCLPIHLRITFGHPQKKRAAGKYMCKCQRPDTCTYINMFARINLYFLLRHFTIVQYGWAISGIISCIQHNR